ncbi:MAG TPA: penicillin-binding protein 2, partial [Verrucomicrobiae bacterium]|nr:penicillin-binding protein 2 [Verrucomicrobiae bacterium]
MICRLPWISSDEEPMSHGMAAAVKNENLCEWKKWLLNRNNDFAAARVVAEEPMGAGGRRIFYGSMARKLQLRRLLMMAVLLAAAFAGLGYRLVDLQVLRHAELSEKAQRNTIHETVLQPRRGDILDARGNLLATSVFVKTVCADPTLIGGHERDIARALAPVLQMNETELAEKLAPRFRESASGETNPVRYVVLKRKVAAETWQKAQAVMLALKFGSDDKKLSKAERTFYDTLRSKAIFADPLDDQLRVYPNQRLAAHVLGYTGMRDADDGITTCGKDGIEQSFDATLRGVSGWRLTERDQRHREVVPLREQDVEPRDGLNVVLTIDSVIQSILETALAQGMEKNSPASISGIVVRPRTGEILALATLPNFDPNNPGAAPADARRNRIIADVAEPGSTFKIVVVSGALNDSLVKLTDAFDCEHGHFFYAGRNLHDHKAYGTLTVQDIITKSSNIGAAKIGIKMGEDRLYDYIRRFGFGSATGIPLQGEVGGIVHSVKNW